MTIIDRKPILFARTDGNIWTDPYIQQHMLAEHLNQDSDGASLRKESIAEITDFILSNSKPKSRLLDLGCGPGLYATLFNNKGFQVTGIDFNAASIDYAISMNKEITYICDDYIKNYPEGQFDTVIMIYCDMGTHPDTERDILLKNIYHSLDEGGVLIFDVFTEELTKDKTEVRNWQYAPEGGFWYESEYLLLSQTFHYPEKKAFAYQYNLLTNKNNKHFIVWDRYYSADEITGVVKLAGFNDVSIHTDIFQDNNFTSSSEMFILARK